MSRNDPDYQYYDPLKLPGYPDPEPARLEFIWSRWIRAVKGFFTRRKNDAGSL